MLLGDGAENLVPPCDVPRHARSIAIPALGTPFDVGE